MREALSVGAESAVQILGKHGPKLAKLKKADRERVRDAKMWLEMCKSLGLFAAPEPVRLPAELAVSEPEEQPAEGDLSDFLGQGESSTGDEAVTSDCKVEA